MKTVSAILLAGAMIVAGGCVFLVDTSGESVDVTWADDADAGEDQALASRVRGVLDENGFADDDIRVGARLGRVYLKGEMERPERLAEVMELVRGVDGVRAIESRIRVETDSD